MSNFKDAAKLFRYGGVIKGGVVLEFTLETQSNNLTYHQPYSKRQQIIFNLIECLHEDKGCDFYLF